MGSTVAAVGIAPEAQLHLAAVIQGPGPTSDEEDELEEDWDEDLDPDEVVLVKFVLF